MRNNYDLSPFRRATVGLDRLFDMLENGMTEQAADNYPPLDLEQEANDRYRITLAVAGFRPDEIDITSQQNLLIVSGKKRQQDERSYVHRGIAARSFERRFALDDYVQVRSADLREGLLSIELVRELPERMKPRRIEIHGTEGAARLSDQRDPPANENQKDRVAA
ncbi:Hsp20 family protein [Sphingomonas parva]|uniref:Hsp20 family protein n=1 Tax=Sphingomonas parva TaxID=2555898 RepID=A0A4Y8ZMG1_9SPHN|nr:Hsp20 family protein [Sphingomonas parva]TFI57134.1 Hsp20 family protein [Sphingomonas parva]